jgi:uncharacterized protein YndB with AHSA1/START domain
LVVFQTGRRHGLPRRRHPTHHRENPSVKPTGARAGVIGVANANPATLVTLTADRAAARSFAWLPQPADPNSETRHAKERTMPDILHKVGIQRSSPNDVYKALTTLERLSGWWTTTTTGASDKRGGVIQFRFGAGGFDMKVLELAPGKRVLWQVVDGPEEWIGTTVSFDIRQEDSCTILVFKHQGWKEPVEFMHHCSTKWAVFLLSLKSLLETGAGAPAPNEIKLDAWE